MLNRRHFLYSSSMAGLMPTLRSPLAFAEQVPVEPHFFIHYSMTGGLDKLYTFDSRPLDMMAQKIQLNYLDREPRLVKNDTGGMAYFSHLVDPLMAYQDYFSVINGVMMSPAFDGHIENANEVLAGQPLGGEFYMPALDMRGLESPLAFIQLGQGLQVATLSNLGKGVNFSLPAAHNLKDKISRLKSRPSRLQSYFDQSFALSPDSKGGFEKSRLLMGRGDAASSHLAKVFAGIEVPDLPVASPDQNNQNTLPQDIDLAIALFKSGTSRAVLYLPGGGNAADRNLDTHDPASAKRSPVIVSTYLDDMTVMFKKLHETPYDSRRSMLDVTTVLITSEISRTMCSQFSGRERFLESGTDHNQLSNTVILGGKGIRPKMVVGSSDFQSVAEFEKGPSKAHLSKDKDKVKTMGRPFDYSSFRERSDLPDVFKLEDYISINSVVNTVYRAFGISEESWRGDARSGVKFPTLNSLLK